MNTFGCGIYGKYGGFWFAVILTVKGKYGGFGMPWAPGSTPSKYHVTSPYTIQSSIRKRNTCSMVKLFSGLYGICKLDH
jgi:hypothetical protein